jgi:predicted dehydrogenase
MPIGLNSYHIHVWQSLLDQAGIPLGAIPGEWDAFWDFWCDTVQPLGEVRLRTEAGEQVLPVERENLYVRAVRRFHGAVRGVDTPAATGEDGMRSLALALAVREAAYSGRRVRVDPASTA